MRALAAVMATGVAMAVAAPAVAAPTVAQLQRQVKAEKARAAKLQRALTREKERVFLLRTDVSELRARVRDVDADLVAVIAERDGLRSSYQGLSGQVATIAGERDAANQQLVLARNGLPGLIAAMSLPDAFALLPEIYRKFPSNSLVWRADLFTSGSYRSYSFTYSP